MNNTDNCPHCNVSWLGEKIPEQDREKFGNATHFKREIGIYSLRRDMTIAWKCPDCGTYFDRFTMKEINEEEIL